MALGTAIVTRCGSEPDWNNSIAENNNHKNVTEATDGSIKMKYSAMAGVLFLTLAACSPISQQAQQDLARPINCATAEGDVRVLRSEKAHVVAQIAAGVTALVPAAAVMSVATGSEVAKLQVASGDYNKAIDDKIALIKKTCGV